jgi:hypothetical protein
LTASFSWDEGSSLYQSATAHGNGKDLEQQAVSDIGNSQRLKQGRIIVSALIHINSIPPVYPGRLGINFEVVREKFQSFYSQNY